MNKRRFFYSLSIIILLIVIVAGWFATDYLGNKARQEIISESQASALALSTYVSTTFNNLNGAVKSLAGSPWITPALMSKSDQDIKRANSVLDRYNAALNASVSYLMDADGMTVASSNRSDPDSFVGKSYRFRPYFQEAAKGQPYNYFALGITSGKRGFYASYPVQNRPGKVLGVVTMKKDIDEMANFFRQFPFAFLINRDGIILLSSKPAMVLKSLWPLDKSVRDKLMISRQFGNQFLGHGFLKKEIADGNEVTLEENNYLVSRKLIDSDGLSIVILAPTEHIGLYKLIGILTTISVVFLIMIFSIIIYMIDRSQEAIRQSEESKRLLLHSSGEGIFGVDAKGLLTFVNPAALRMLGFVEEEMLGQSVHSLIHHSLENGTKYPAEDCPMYNSYTRGAESYVTDEVLWCKNGSSFPVEYSSMPIIKGGKVTGAVVTFKDITERKKMQSELQDTNLDLAKAYQELREEQALVIQQAKMASIGVLAAGVAHEIKNPLAIMLQGISYLQSTNNSDSIQIEVIARLHTAVLRTDKIVKGLISYSSQNPLTLEKQDILEIIEESLTLTEHEFGKKNLQLIKQYATDLPRVSVDGNQINQVFVNVLLNGMEAMSPGGTFTINARQIADNAGKNFLEISFKDTGQGIPADKIDKIFDPFYTSKAVGSTGLGLSISRGIIDKHGGTIQAESQIGQGTSIIIKLPVTL